MCSCDRPVQTGQSPACQEGASGNTKMKTNPYQHVEPRTHHTGNPGLHGTPACARQLRECLRISGYQPIDTNAKIRSESCSRQSACTTGDGEQFCGGGGHVQFVIGLDGIRVQPWSSRLSSEPTAARRAISRSGMRRKRRLCLMAE